MLAGSRVPIKTQHSLAEHQQSTATDKQRKCHGNRLGGQGAVEGRKSPSPIDKAHGLCNSLYYRTSRDMFLMYNIIIII